MTETGGRAPTGEAGLGRAGPCAGARPAGPDRADPRRRGRQPEPRGGEPSALPDIGKSFDSSQTTLNLIVVGYSFGLAALGPRPRGPRRPVRAQDDARSPAPCCRSPHACSPPTHPPTACSRWPASSAGSPPAWHTPPRSRSITAALGRSTTDAVDRAVVGDRRRDLGAGAADRRRTARALLVGIGVPRHPPARGGCAPPRVKFRPQSRERGVRPGRQLRRHPLRPHGRCAHPRHQLLAPVPDKKTFAIGLPRHRDRGGAAAFVIRQRRALEPAL